MMSLPAAAPHGWRAEINMLNDLVFFFRCIKLQFGGEESQNEAWSWLAANQLSSVVNTKESRFDFILSWDLKVINAFILASDVLQTGSHWLQDRPTASPTGGLQCPSWEDTMDVFKMACVFFFCTQCYRRGVATAGLLPGQVSLCQRSAPPLCHQQAAITWRPPAWLAGQVLQGETLCLLLGFYFDM